MFQEFVCGQNMLLKNVTFLLNFRMQGFGVCWECDKRTIKNA